MKYNKNEVTGKMRDRIILQNVTRVRSLTGFASEIWTDTTTIWAFAESKLPGSNETIIEGKNTAKNICDFTIRYISSITEESRVVFKNKIYQVENIKISHDRRFISFQGVYYDSYSTVIGLQSCSASLLAQSSLSAALMRVIKYQASLNAFGSVSADIALVQKVASSLNAFGTLTGDITFVKNMQAALNGTAALSGGITFVQKPEASLNAFGTLVSDLKIAKTFESSLNANGTLVSNTTIAKNLASSLTSSNSLAASALVLKLASASLTGAGTTAANLTVNAPSAGLLLDTYPNAAAAYSLRKLRTAYTGSAIRVRANTSGAEGDVSFDVNNTISASSTVTVTAVGTSGLSIGQQVTFSTFWNAGGSNQNVFVTTWYDQSGNARNATQTTQANQPQIVSSGVIVLVNAKPALKYVDLNDSLRISSNFDTFNNTSIFNVCDPLVYIDSSINARYYDLYDGTRHIQYINDGVTNRLFVRNSLWQGPSIPTQFTTQNSPTNQFLSSLLALSSSNDLYVNNIIQNKITGGANVGEAGTISIIGMRSDSNNSTNFIGDYQELVIYQNNQSSNRVAIETNINTHYAIY